MPNMTFLCLTLSVDINVDDNANDDGQSIIVQALYMEAYHKIPAVCLHSIFKKPFVKLLICKQRALGNNRKLKNLSTIINFQELMIIKYWGNNSYLDLLFCLKHAKYGLFNFHVLI